MLQQKLEIVVCTSKGIYIWVPLIIEVNGEEAHDHQAIDCVAQNLPMQSRPTCTCTAIWVTL